MNRPSIQALCLHPDDNVATLLEAGADGDVILIYSRSGERIAALPCNGIPRGHKIALVDLQAGQAIRKYGQVIGVCTADITRGGWVHVHNMESVRGRGDHEPSTETVINK
jgi:hypothetical protein